MTDMSLWKPMVDQPIHSFPGEARFLAATPERPVPVSRHLESKRLQRMTIHRHPVVTVVSDAHRLEPRSNVGNRLMHAPSQFGFHFLELGSKPLLDREPPHRETSVASLGPADMREPQEVERFRFPLAAILPVLVRVRTKFQKARLVRMQLQSILQESLLQSGQKLLGLPSMLKPHDEVIGPASNDHITLSLCLSPVVRPEVEHVMQVDVRQPGRGTSALRRSFFAAFPLALFQHARVQPSLDEPHDSLGRDTVL